MYCEECNNLNVKVNHETELCLKCHLVYIKDHCVHNLDDEDLYETDYYENI